MLACLLVLTACGHGKTAEYSEPPPAPQEEKHEDIERIRLAMDPSATVNQELRTGDDGEIWNHGQPNWLGRLDARGTDLGQEQVPWPTEELWEMMFDSNTRWPADLNPDFDPQQVLEQNNAPGLGVRQVHDELGLTGKGINVAIIDQPLLTTHEEYRDTICYYKSLQTGDHTATMHGSAVASILVGKNAGVAPGANLYYLVGYESGLDNIEQDVTESLLYLLNVNETLPPEQKIQVISISNSTKGDAYMEALEQAKEQGVFVVDVGCRQYRRVKIAMLGRQPMSDPDELEKLLPGSLAAENFYSSGIEREQLWIPTDHITTASPTGDADTVYYSVGGMSWAVPYLAGVYALALEARPELTPEEFWEAAYDTAVTVPVEKDGKTYTLNRVIQPLPLLQKLHADR